MNTFLLVWYALGWVGLSVRCKYGKYQEEIRLIDFLFTVFLGFISLMFWVGYCQDEMWTFKTPIVWKRKRK